MAYINGNRVVKTMIPTYLDLDTVYPIGSVYISVNSTSPASLFGGTWEKISGKFLLGISDNNELGDTGGNATHNHNAGTLNAKIGFQSDDSGESLRMKYATSQNFNSPEYITYTLGTIKHNEGFWASNRTEVDGATDSANNLPPYIKVAIWKRTA